MVCKAIAVEDSDMAMEIVNAIFQSIPSSLKITKEIRTVPKTCKEPIPTIVFRIFQKLLGSISRPIRNNITTTPNSAKCMISCPSSPTNPRIQGPMITPAIKYPKTELSPNFLAIGTQIIAPRRKIITVNRILPDI